MMRGYKNYLCYCIYEGEGISLIEDATFKSNSLMMGVTELTFEIFLMLLLLVGFMGEGWKDSLFWCYLTLSHSWKRSRAF